MNSEREHAVSAAFVTLASDLVNGVDVVEMLTYLTTTCVSLLDVSSAALLLADRRQVLHLVAASSEATRSVELFQLQRHEGPCLDCFAAAAPVSVPDLAAAAESWPQFVPAALEHGFASVHAVPVRLRDRVLGSLGLFGSQVGALNHDDLGLAQALADVVCVALVQDRAASDAELVNQQLQSALNSRVILEQAKGVIANVSGLEVEVCFDILRSFARNHNRKLSELSRAIVTREQDPQEVLLHSRSHGVESQRRIT